MNSFKLNQYCTNYTAVNKWMIKMHCEVIMCIGKMSNIFLNKSTSMYTCRIEINLKTIYRYIILLHLNFTSRGLKRMILYKEK